MPEEFTVGRLSAQTLRADAVRDRLIGYGFEECITNILTAEHPLRGAVGVAADAGITPLSGSGPVQIANVMSLSYSCLRDWLLPSLLQVEARSAQATYPHRIFEVGEVAVADAAEALRSRTDLRIAALVAHETASISEAQAYLNALLQHFRVSYTLAPGEHPSFIPGRFASIHVAGRSEPVGLLGEIHPEVLAGEQGFGVRVPCATFELSLTAVG
jgi:phenylalanyl-tRNA synthetase beta chain